MMVFLRRKTIPAERVFTELPLEDEFFWRGGADVGTRRRKQLQLSISRNTCR